MVNIILLGDNSTPDKGDGFSNYLGVRKFQAAKTGTLKEMHIWLSNPCYCVVGIYSDDDGEPSTLLVSSSVVQKTANDLEEIILSTEDFSVVKDTYYWLAWSFSYGGMGYISEPGGVVCKYKSMTYTGSLPSEAGTGFGGNWNRDDKISGYGLEPSAGYPSQVIIM